MFVVYEPRPMNYMQVYYQLVILTETWLTDSFQNVELFEDRYTVVRQDRDNEKTIGGDLLYSLL